MEFDLSIPIRRSPEAVYAVLADIQRYAGGTGSPVPEMEKIPPGETRIGTRWREVVRLLPFRTMTVWSEVVAAVPGRRLTETFHGPWMTGRLAYEIEPTPDGAVLLQRETLTPHGPLRLNTPRHRFAETLRQPLGTIKTRIRLAMQKLRDLLREEPGDTSVDAGSAYNISKKER